MWPDGMKTLPSTKTTIHENPKEAASDVFQELYGLQIFLILPDPHMSFELEHWLRCKY